MEEIFGRFQEISGVARLEPISADDEQGPDPCIGICLDFVLLNEVAQYEDLDALFERNESVVAKLATARRALTLRGRFGGAIFSATSPTTSIFVSGRGCMQHAT